MMQIVEELNTLHLDLLDQDWVQGIYYSEFLEFGDFPPEYENVLESIEIRKVFKNVMKAIDSWLHAEDEEEKSWTELSQHIEHQRLLAILAYYIDYGTKNILTKEYRNNALLASRVYYKFLSISGYKAYHIYHSQLFAHSLACLSFPKALCDHEDNYFNNKELTKEVNSIIKELRHFVLDLRAVIDSLQLNPSDMNFEDILSNLVDITGGAIVNKLNVDKIELANISRVIYEIIDILICDANQEPNASAIQLLFKCILPKLVAASVDCKNANNLVRASYVTYSGLLLSKYGKAALTGYNVLLQHLCYTPEGLERAEVRQARVQLVVGLMSLLPQKSYRSIVKWILKLSTTAKVSHRHIALELLAKLLSNEPEDEKPLPQLIPQSSENPETQTSEGGEQISGENQNQTKDGVTNETSDSVTQPENPEGVAQPAGATESVTQPTDTTEGIAQAPVTTEGVAQAPETTGGTPQPPETSNGITQPPDSTVDNTPSLETTISELLPLETFDGELLPLGTIDGELPPLETADFDLLPFETSELLPLENGVTTPPNTASQTPETTKSEIQTSKTTVTGTNSSKSEPQTPKSTVANVETQPPIDLPQIATTDDETSQDSQDVELTEDDVAGLLRQRAHTAPHAQILRAVYERVNDTSSTLRTRALHILTDCLDTHRGPMKEAIQELQGSGAVSRLLALGARGVCDERAAVRRAALALVHRSLAARGAPPPQPHDLGILVGLCRDASIIVRSAAIAALGELATTRSSDAVLDAFLTGPMHQLSDPETKVQEQVVNLIQQLLIDRLRQYSAAQCEDPLPWMFLAAVARHNMRRHLQKACGLLAKNTSCISHRLVDIVSTHLGAHDEERDLQALVLLTSVATHVDYNEIQFALDYYYKLAEDPETCSGRLMALALELVSGWARWARLGPRSALRDHLVQRLAAAHDDGCRLACATLAAQLDPLSLTWATELMQLSERRAVGSTCVREWVRAADLSLVAPAPPSPVLLKLFLRALSDPPPEWSAECLGTAVAGLGRLCVRSRDAAAAAAPPLAALLRDAAAPLAARVNALLALTDICTRYTCIVEPLLGCVCGCLAAEAAPALRRAAARALTRLLLAGYLRLRTPLYYRYCALLADEDHDVREPAEYYVTCCLTADAIYHHFVDCILHYNKDDSENISFDARQLIYDVMLQRLSIVQKLNLQCRLAREVLEHAADVTDESDDELPPALNAALLDTSTLLVGPRMKLPKKPQRDGDAADIDDLHERVTTNIVSHKMKRTVAEVVVPAVLRLYARLRARGGQVAAYLVRLATDLLNDYRHEIEELIENDEELVERVRQFQETIGIEPSFGNARNLVTASTTNEPETPRAPRKRAIRAARSPPRKRALRI